MLYDKEFIDAIKQHFKEQESFVDSMSQHLFRVKCDEELNTPDVIDRNELRVRVFLYNSSTKFVDDIVVGDKLKQQDS